MPNNTSDVLEEGFECPENEYLHVSNKNCGICSNDKIYDNAKSCETPIKDNHGNISLIVRDSK